ncbi:MAG: hypothetical protein ACK5JT_13865 [Hyphomicrobiaceae bacterium]
MRLFERAGQITRHEAPQFDQFDMIVVAVIHQMMRELGSAAALRTFENHRS